MSKIGKQPIVIPGGVEVNITGNVISVKGSKGNLSRTLPEEIEVVKNENELLVNRKGDDRHSRSLHGLCRTLINNMIIGVTEGFSKVLNIVGVGYRAALKGTGLNLQLGFSHPVEVAAPSGISFEVGKDNSITIKGIDKELVGQVAANIRKLRKPEPYKGKGIMYAGEHIVRKAGKKGGK